MAKLKSLLKIEGTLGGITFYKTKDGNLVREKGGVSKEKILNDPRYARTRENMQEFSSSAKACKLLRDAISPLLSSAKDSGVNARLLKIMSAILKEDSTNMRGWRSPANGLLNATGKMMLKSFNFNIASPLSSILNKAFELDQTTGVISINDLVPMNNLSVPVGATHVGFSGAMLKIDFETRIYDCKLTNVQNIMINSVPSTITLTPANIPIGNGITICFLKIEFFQEINTIQYSLRNGAFNSLAVIEIV